MEQNKTLPGMENFKKTPTKKKSVKKKLNMVVGKKEMYDPTTGENIECTVIQKNVDTDVGFHKIWLQDLLMVLNTVGEKKTMILTYLLSIMDNRDNSVVFTQEMVSDIVGVSRPTVSAVIKELLKVNALTQDKQLKQRYFFNPDLIIQGKSTKRKRLLIEYNLHNEEKIKDDKFLNQKLPDAMELLGKKGDTNGN
jgi:predicted XRE-type DNA-binding protein